MGLNPKAPTWTPGPSSIGHRRGDSLRWIRRAVHGVGTHKSEGRAETLGVGGLSLPMKKYKHWANLYDQRAQQAIRKRSRAGRGLAKASARLARERQKSPLVKVAPYNVRSLFVKGANGYYGRNKSCCTRQRHKT